MIQMDEEGLYELCSSFANIRSNSNKACITKKQTREIFQRIFQMNEVQAEDLLRRALKRDLTADAIISFNQYLGIAIRYLVGDSSFGDDEMEKARHTYESGCFNHSILNDSLQKLFDYVQLLNIEDLRRNMEKSGRPVVMSCRELVMGTDHDERNRWSQMNLQATRTKRLQRCRSTSPTTTATATTTMLLMTSTTSAATNNNGRNNHTSGSTASYGNFRINSSRWTASSSASFQTESHLPSLRVKTPTSFFMIKTSASDARPDFTYYSDSHRKLTDTSFGPLPESRQGPVTGTIEADRFARERRAMSALGFKDVSSTFAVTWGDVEDILQEPKERRMENISRGASALATLKKAIGIKRDSFGSRPSSISTDFSTSTTNLSANFINYSAPPLGKSTALDMTNQFHSFWSSQHVDHYKFPDAKQPQSMSFADLLPNVKKQQKKQLGSMWVEDMSAGLTGSRFVQVRAHHASGAASNLGMAARQKERGSIRAELEKVFQAYASHNGFMNYHDFWKLVKDCNLLLGGKLHPTLFDIAFLKMGGWLELQDTLFRSSGGPKVAGKGVTPGEQINTVNLSFQHWERGLSWIGFKLFPNAAGRDECVHLLLYNHIFRFAKMSSPHPIFRHFVNDAGCTMFMRYEKLLRQVFGHYASLEEFWQGTLIPEDDDHAEMTTDTWLEFLRNFSLLPQMVTERTATLLFLDSRATKFIAGDARLSFKAFCEALGRIALLLYAPKQDAMSVNGEPTSDFIPPKRAPMKPTAQQQQQQQQQSRPTTTSSAVIPKLSPRRDVLISERYKSFWPTHEQYVSSNESTTKGGLE